MNRKNLLFPHFFCNLSIAGFDIFMSFTSDNLYSLSSFTLFSFQGTTNIVSDAFASGGDEEDRTPDPLLARQVLSQLSYTPK